MSRTEDLWQRKREDTFTCYPNHKKNPVLYRARFIVLMSKFAEAPANLASWPVSLSHLHNFFEWNLWASKQRSFSKIFLLLTLSSSQEIIFGCVNFFYSLAIFRWLLNLFLTLVQCTHESILSLIFSRGQCELDIGVLGIGDYQQRDSACYLVQLKTSFYSF